MCLQVWPQCFRCFSHDPTKKTVPSTLTQNSINFTSNICSQQHCNVVANINTHTRQGLSTFSVSFLLYFAATQMKHAQKYFIPHSNDNNNIRCVLASYTTNDYVQCVCTWSGFIEPDGLQSASTQFQFGAEIYTILLLFFFLLLLLAATTATAARCSLLELMYVVTKANMCLAFSIVPCNRTYMCHARANTTNL